MFDLQIIDDPAIAGVALDPIRSRLLAELIEPASAATLSQRVGITRQKVNYHLRALESNGLVSVAEERKWGGLKERLMVASSSSYVLSPSVMGAASVDVSRLNDKLSASYLIALAARQIREVGGMLKLSRSNNKRLATLSIDTTIHFRRPSDRAEFTEELTRMINELAGRYHDETTPNCRPHRLVVMSHPVPANDSNEEKA